MSFARLSSGLAAICLLLNGLSFSEATDSLELKPHDRIVLVGGTVVERMELFNRFETKLQARFPELELVVRNLGWSADEVDLRPRSKDFQDHGHSLADHKATVVFAFWGFNESFGGPDKVDEFKRKLTDWTKQTLNSKFDGEQNPRVVLFSPMAHEDLGNPNLPDGSQTNENLEIYTAAIKEVAEATGCVFVDAFHPSLKAMNADDEPWTINGIHQNDHGDQQLANILDDQLFGGVVSSDIDMEALHQAVAEKNHQFWYDYRAVNGYYIYGGRKEPFGVVNFPAEFAKLRKMVENRDRRVWEAAQGKELSPEIDDSNTGEFAEIATNVQNEILISSPEETLKSFKLPEGYEINLFASEIEFPELENPCQIAIDAQGRVWVCTMPSYPMYLPGIPVDDKILILEDTDGDGKADKKTVFADGLHVPTGIELGDGGCYVAQQPNLVFLKDTDGDDVADVREVVLHGFDSADSHHSISAFTWGPGGALYFQEGTFHHTQVETPYGPERVKDAAVFRFEPRTDKFDVFVSYPFANPWGHTFDDWGQNFVADASGGANYYGTAFSGDVVYPHKRPGMEQFFTKQWRPTSGCELVSSRNFPEDAQGNYLLNNCIGFHGVLQYRVKEAGSGFEGEPVEPLLQSSDTNFRPVDLEFGADGGLYICDWFNPLIGHMQHSLRDPNRDKNHGRVWRITYSKKPVLPVVDLSSATTPELLDQLKEYEYRVRYRARRELGARDTDEVISATQKWIGELDPMDENYQHHLLEALWLHQVHNVVDAELLKKMLGSDDYRARAAATRVLCYWRDQVDGTLEMLRTQINDEHPRVRLEAIRAVSFLEGPEAEEVALEVLNNEMDYYLNYTFDETLKTLEHKSKDQ